MHVTTLKSAACMRDQFSPALLCRAACAVMGFVGTWVGEALGSSIGLLRTGVCALVLQAGSLALAAVSYRYSHSSIQGHSCCQDDEVRN